MKKFMENSQHRGIKNSESRSNMNKSEVTLEDMRVKMTGAHGSNVMIIPFYTDMQSLDGAKLIIPNSKIRNHREVLALKVQGLVEISSVNLLDEGHRCGIFTTILKSDS